MSLSPLQCATATDAASALPRVLLLGPRGAGKSTFMQGFTDSQQRAANKPTVAGDAPIERTLEWGEDRAALLVDRCGPRCFDTPVAAIVFVVDASNAASLEREAKPLLDAALARAPPQAALLVLANKQDVRGALSVPEVERRLGLSALVAEGRACHIEGSSLAHAAGASPDDGHAEDFAARGVDWLLAQLHGEDPLLAANGSGTDHALRGGDNTSDEEDDDAPAAVGQDDELYGGRLQHLPCVATACADFLGSEDGPLSFRFGAGQQLVLYADKGGIMRGSLLEGGSVQGRLGAFPKNLVQVSEFEMARAARAAASGAPILPPKPQILCLLLGLLGAGKSTLLARLRKPSSAVNRMAVAPTLQFTPECFELGARAQFGVYDLGRGEQLQAKAIREQRAKTPAASTEATQHQQLPWSFTSEQAQAVIFVVDSADPARLDEAREELLRILRDPRLLRSPLLILASKADLPGALSLQQIRHRMQLDSIIARDRAWSMEACSVKLVGDAQTPEEQASSAAAAASSTDATVAAATAAMASAALTPAASNSSDSNRNERKDCESKVADEAAADGAEGLVRGFRWIAEQLHPAAAASPAAADAAAAVPAASPAPTLASLQSLPSFEPFADPIAAVATNYTDAASAAGSSRNLALYPGQRVEVLGIVKEPQGRFVVRTRTSAAASASSSSSSSASATASAAPASTATAAAASAAAASIVGLVPFNTLRSCALSREYDAQMAHVARGTRVDPSANRYVAVGDWEGRGASVEAAAAPSSVAVAAACPSAASPAGRTSGELSFQRGSTLLVTRDLGHWLRGHVQGAVAGSPVGAEGLIPSAWVRTAAFVESRSAKP